VITSTNCLIVFCSLMRCVIGFTINEDIYAYIGNKMKRSVACGLCVALVSADTTETAFL